MSKRAIGGFAHRETPGPRPSARERELELLIDTIELVDNLMKDFTVLRAHLERRGESGPIGVRVMACLLHLAVMQQKLCQLQIVALSGETND